MLRACAAIAALLACAPAQQTWIVDRQNRPGAHFTDMPAAVAAAQPGDTLMFRPNNVWPPVGSYTVVPIDKGIRLLGRGTQVQTIFSGPLQFANLPAGQTAIVQGLWMAPDDSSPSPHAGIDCQACLGGVQVENLKLSLGPMGSGLASVSVVDCANVSLRSCVLTTSATVMVTRSYLRISRSSILAWLYLAALAAVDSRVVCDSSNLQGSYSYWAYECGFWVLVGVDRPAVQSTNSVLYFGPGTEFVNCGVGPVTGSFTVYRDPSVPFNPFVANTQTPLPLVEAGKLHAEQQASATIAAGAGNVAVLAIGHHCRAPTLLPFGPTGPFGLLCMDPATMNVVGIARGDAQGVARFCFGLDLPPGMPVVLQGVVVQPDNSLRVTLPDVQIVGG